MRNKLNKRARSGEKNNGRDRSGLTRRSFLGQTVAWAGGALALSFPAFSRGENLNLVPSGITTTTRSAAWQQKIVQPLGFRWDALDIEIFADRPQQFIEGFGGCFNELGWMSLQKVTQEDRAAIFRELFSPGIGANFTICRMPIGANDFSRDWYSYDETPDDYDLKHFSIDNDLRTLVPFIHSAQLQNSGLKLWASPWSPPTWMKHNHHYAEARPMAGFGTENGLKPEQVGQEGTDMFLQEEKYFRTYAAYFGRFIDAYRQQGIEIGMVMPQNEFNSAQSFPSCTWTPEGLARFLRYLGPEMSRRHVEIFFGTLERGNIQLLDVVMNDPEAGKYVQGVGVQWAGKNAVAAIHQRYPRLKIYQSEQECGDGKNDWNYCAYTWDLMRHYLKNGANGYMYWNIALEPGGLSHWGWPQNSLITVDPATKSYKYNYEYYLLKHVSHFVRAGARRLETEGVYDDLLAFRNPDGSVVAVLRNESSREKTINLTMAGKKISFALEPDSFNTVVFQS